MPLNSLTSSEITSNEEMMGVRAGVFQQLVRALAKAQKQYPDIEQKAQYPQHGTHPCHVRYVHHYVQDAQQHKQECHDVQTDLIRTQQMGNDDRRKKER